MICPNTRKQKIKKIPEHLSIPRNNNIIFQHTLFSNTSYKSRSRLEACQPIAVETST